MLECHAMPRIYKSAPIEERLLNSSSPEPMSGCWLWTKATTRGGYAVMRTGSKTDGTCQDQFAHIVSYRHFRGPIPIGLELDHTCRVTCCINPDHLEAVTHRTNVLRGKSPTAGNAQKTHCPNGHPYDLRRICSMCRCEAQKRRRIMTNAA